MIAPSGNGWLVTCEPCHWEFYSTRRPTADKAAHEHKCRVPKQPKSSAAPPKPRADWTNREDSTWIDKL